MGERVLSTAEALEEGKEACVLIDIFRLQRFSGGKVVGAVGSGRGGLPPAPRKGSIINSFGIPKDVVEED